MAGLQYLCVDVNNGQGIRDLLPQMLGFPVVASESLLEPLLEPFATIAVPLLLARLPSPSASDTSINLTIPTLDSSL